MPCYNEEKNLPLLYAQLQQVLGGAQLSWELIAVDDHSADATFAVTSALARQDSRVRGIRLARNVGSHVAAMCGLEHSRGAAVVVMAADLEDPPEFILRLIERWRANDQVVWAVREVPRKSSAANQLFARAFHALMGRIAGREQLTSEGSDFFLVDRAVVSALISVRERNLSLFSMLVWLGFRQSAIYYAKRERQHGASGWTLRKKIKLVINSVTAFSYVPIRLMSVFGVSVAVFGFVYAIVLTVNRMVGGVPIEGWTSLMVVVLVMGGIQMTMLGVLGEYLWRALDEARRRPRYNIESVTTSPTA